MAVKYKANRKLDPFAESIVTEYISRQKLKELGFVTDLGKIDSRRAEALILVHDVVNSEPKKMGKK